MKYKVPLYSQYCDITEDAWKSKGCGIVCVKMICDYSNSLRTESMSELLKEAIAKDMFVAGVGWKHEGLALLLCERGVQAKTYDWNLHASVAALVSLKNALQKGPVIASIKKDFLPTGAGHLIVVVGSEPGILWYNDPAIMHKEQLPKKISENDFCAGWKQRGILLV